MTFLACVNVYLGCLALFLALAEQAPELPWHD
jgi:hypothetical protein